MQHPRNVLHEKGYALPPPFFLLARWNEDLVAGAQVTMLDPKVEVTSSAWQTCVIKGGKVLDTTECHSSSGLLLHETEINSCFL